MRPQRGLSLAWVGPGVPVRVLLDSGYMARDVVHGLPKNVVVFGAIRTNSALFASWTVPTGRRRKGDRLPTPAQMGTDGQRWAKVNVTLYGRECIKSVRSHAAPWWHVFGEAAGRLVVVREDSRKVRAFFCTDPTLSATEVLVGYSFRWPPSDGAPLTPKLLKLMIQRAERRASMKVTGRCHILRHTFCSHLAMAGASVVTIQNLAGHQNLETTMGHMHLSPKATDEAMRLLTTSRESVASRGNGHDEMKPQPKKSAKLVEAPGIEPGSGSPSPERLRV